MLFLCLVFHIYGRLCWIISGKSLLHQLHPVLHPLRKLLQSADHVGRQALVDLLGVGEAKAGHQGDELLLGLRQPGVVLLLLAHGGASQAWQRNGESAEI